MFLKTIIAISLISSLIIISGIYTKLSEFSTVSRVFMNLKDGGKKSLQEGLLFIKLHLMKW